VALPLSMAIAIASGVTPDRGLYTAIVGGFCVSALGGSRFQIGGVAQLADGSLLFRTIW
jgi:SulP family sulfate permease